MRFHNVPFSLIKCFILDGFFFGEGKVPIVVSSSSYHSCDRTTEGMVAMGNKFGVTSKKCTVIVKARMPHGFPDKPLCCKFQKFNGCGLLSAIKFSIFARSKLHEPFKPHQPAYESTESNGLICGFFFWEVDHSNLIGCVATGCPSAARIISLRGLILMGHAGKKCIGCDGCSF